MNAYAGGETYIGKLCAEKDEQAEKRALRLKWAAVACVGRRFRSPIVQNLICVAVGSQRAFFPYLRSVLGSNL